jgi:hypothetical protein
MTAHQDADAEFAEQPPTNVVHVPTRLLLDTSHSMTHETADEDGTERRQIDQLNDGLELFKQEVEDGFKTERAVDISLVTFGGDVSVGQEFSEIDDWQPPTLSAGPTRDDVAGRRCGPRWRCGRGSRRRWCVFGHDGSYEPSFPPEEAVTDLDAAHETFPLTHDAWREFYRFGYRGDVDSIAVLADGLSQWAWNGDHEANATWFESAVTLIEAASEPERATQSLREALDNDNYRQSRDDRFERNTRSQ